VKQENQYLNVCLSKGGHQVSQNEVIDQALGYGLKNEEVHEGVYEILSPILSLIVCESITLTFSIREWLHLKESLIDLSEDEHEEVVS
jgi:hypothetical protein